MSKEFIGTGKGKNDRLASRIHDRKSNLPCLRSSSLGEKAHSNNNFIIIKL